MEHKSTDAEVMAKKSPKKKPAPIEGEPNMAKLLRVLLYLWNWFKFHRMTASPVGLLYIRIRNQSLYLVQMQMMQWEKQQGRDILLPLIHTKMRIP